MASERGRVRALLCLVVLLAGCAAPQLPSRSSNIVGADNTVELEEAWRAPFAHDHPGWTPSPDGRTLLFLNATTLLLVDDVTGAQRRVPLATEVDYVETFAEEEGGIVLVQRSGERVEAVRPSGEVLWSEVVREWSIVAFAELTGAPPREIVSFQARDFRAISLDNGATLWSLRSSIAQAPTGFQAADLDGDGRDSLATIVGSEILVIAPDGSVEDRRPAPPLPARLALFTPRGGAPEIVVLTYEGAGNVSLGCDASAQTVLDWQGDGAPDVLAGCANGGVHAIDLAKGTTARLSETGRLLAAGALSPGGPAFAAILREDGRITFVNAAGTTLFLSATSFDGMIQPGGGGVLGAYRTVGGQRPTELVRLRLVAPEDAK